MSAVLVDTGPLVAYWRQNDEHHSWARAQMNSLRRPLLTCEPVIAEAGYLLGEYGHRTDVVWEFFRRGILKIAFGLEAELECIAGLMRRYQDIPMDLADACLVRMSELAGGCEVLTVDGDFKFYRRFGRQVIPLICPS